MTRRGRGEGSIYKRIDGRWEGRVDLGWVDGKRRRKTVYGRTRQEVVDKLIVLGRERQLGTLAVGPSVRLSAYLSDWLDSVRASLRSSTYRTYRMYVERHWIPELGTVYVEKLTAAQVQAVLDRKVRDGMAPQSVVHLRAVLRRALNRAVRFGLVGRNVVVLTEPPKVERHEHRVLDDGQARAFLASIARDRLRALYSVALLTGLRQGELLGLTWADIDLDRGQLRVNHALQRQDGRLCMVPPKTARSRRVISLPALAVEALREHRDRLVEDRRSAGARWRDTGLVFATRHGGPLEPGNVVRSFKRALRRAGLPEMRFHDLRHSCATLLLVQGVAPRVVMEILGHSQISLTMNTYTAVIPALQVEAAAKLDELLTRPRGAGETVQGPAGCAAG
jgi:integrase